MGRTLDVFSPSCDGELAWDEPLRRCFARLDGEVECPLLSLLWSVPTVEFPVDGLLLLSSWDFFGVLTFA